MTDNRETNSVKDPKWLKGRGVGPKVKWIHGTDGPLTATAMAAESGDFFVADAAGTLYRLDRKGEISAMTRLHEPLIALVWSADGTAGAGIFGEDSVVRFNRDLKIVHRVSVPEVAISLTISPFGNHLAVGMANGVNLIFNERKRRIAQYETMRPLAFLEFCTMEGLVFGAAEHGLVCCHNLAGAEVWQEKNWSNVGDLRLTGDGDLVYLASFAHGIQTLDGDGASIGAYILEGTIDRVDVSFNPQRLIASTIERHLYWLDADGELLWGTQVDDKIVTLHCDPLAEWGVVGFETQGVMRLNWGGI